MDIFGDHLSYVLLVLFGLVAVGIQAYAQFGQQVPSETSHYGNAVLDSMSVMSLGGQYSVFRGFVFYLVVSESLYIILSSSSMILQLALNATGRAEMAGALSSGIELNPLIPILASSVIISASQIKPLSQVEHSIRRIAHRIAGIPRNVYEIQERIKSTDFNNLQAGMSSDMPGAFSDGPRSSQLRKFAQQSDKYSRQMLKSMVPVKLRDAERKQFQKSLQNVYLLHEFFKGGMHASKIRTSEPLEVQAQVSQYLETLGEMQWEIDSRKTKPDNTLTQAWRVQVGRAYELESKLIKALCLRLGELKGIDTTTLANTNQPRLAKEKISGIVRKREQTSTNLYERDSLILTLGNVFLMRDAFSCLDENSSSRYREQLTRCFRELVGRMNAFEAQIAAMIGDESDSSVAVSAMKESDWQSFFAICQYLETDLLSTLVLLYADAVEDYDTNRFRASSKIARHAENKAARFVGAGETLDLSEFRLVGFKRSLEKVFCLYEWTLGTDGTRIWATQDTQQITLLFESIKHKFDAFENDLNILEKELKNASVCKSETSLKLRWKEVITRCTSLEDDLTLLLALLLINKPDAHLRHYPLLDRLRDHVLERGRNHEMNAFGMSVLYGLFLSLVVLTFHFAIKDTFKDHLRDTDVVTLDKPETDFMADILKPLFSGSGIEDKARADTEKYILDLVSSASEYFLEASLDVIDILIIFCVSAGCALIIRSMRKVERRWSFRGKHEPPPMYSYFFIGIVAYLVSACFVLIYRFIRLVAFPMLDSGASQFATAHLNLFLESFTEFLLFPLTAFVMVWYVLEYMDSKQHAPVSKILWTAFQFASICTLINLVGKIFSESFKTGWDALDFVFVPTLGFLSFMLMFAYCLHRYSLEDDTGKLRNASDYELGFLEIRGFGQPQGPDIDFQYKGSHKREKPDVEVET